MDSACIHLNIIYALIKKHKLSGPLTKNEDTSYSFLSIHLKYTTSLQRGFSFVLQLVNYEKEVWKKLCIWYSAS